ncbi:MAG TPA: helix-hairpin-helix domain-containing protein [Gemmataceae bacterium]|nr:helix-hairpin-helix domain-containing protein [Gemmataceae bacterium]
MTVDDCVDLEDLPNIGPKTAADFRLLGITRPKQLTGKDPYQLYEKLCRATGVRQDPCVLDVFISAVRFVGGEPARPWWYYTKERKRTLSARSRS